MTKEVMISIRGMHFEPDADSNEIETIQWGQYYDKGGTRYVIFDELMEGVAQPIRNTIKFKEHEMSLTKHGPVNVNLLFEEGKKNLTSYRTPMGGLMMGVDTSRVAFAETEEEILLNVDYSMDINYEYLADCSIEIRIEPRGMNG